MAPGTEVTLLVKISQPKIPPTRALEWEEVQHVMGGVQHVM